MTRYTVVWHQAALDELARLWVEAPDRDAVRRAGDAVDENLGVDALRQGAEVAEGLRRLTVPPLAVLFAASEQDRMAKVVGVHRA